MFRCMWERKSGTGQTRCSSQCVSCAIYEKGRMTWDDYTHAARETAIYPREKALEYLALGLASEAGEVAGHIKKLIRDGALYNGEVALELGDVLWYVTMLADEFGYSLEEIAEKNLQKLRDRQERGELGGSGDGR